MFQFPGFALISLCIQPISTWSCRLLIPQGINNQHSGGFPHSEIFGSKPIPGSPKLIAGYHVLHRLLLPRHPPNALIALDLIQRKPRPSPVSKACTFPVPAAWFVLRSLDWLVYLTWKQYRLAPEGTGHPLLGWPAILMCISLNDVNASGIGRSSTATAALDDLVPDDG